MDKRLRGRLDDDLADGRRSQDRVRARQRTAGCLRQRARADGIGLSMEGRGRIRLRTAAYHEDDRDARARPEGASFQLHDYEVPEFIVTAYRRRQRRISELDSRVYGRVISFAPFLLSGSLRLRSRCWFGWPLPGRSCWTARSISRSSFLRSSRHIASRGSLRARACLWRVSRKLILSYVLVGAVPILLLVTFSMLAFLLIFFDISSYLVHDRVDRAHRAGKRVRTDDAVRIERAEPPRTRTSSSGGSRRISLRYPRVSLKLTPTDALPDWVAGRSFSGLVENGRLARAVVCADGPAPRHAVVVDLPVDECARGKRAGCVRESGSARSGRDRFSTRRHI